MLMILFFLILISDFDCAVQDRDNLKYKLNELQRENQRFKEKLQSITPNYEASRRECEHLSEQRDQLKSTVTELKRDNQQLKVSYSTCEGFILVSYPSKGFIQDIFLREGSK